MKIAFPRNPTPQPTNISQQGNASNSITNNGSSKRQLPTKKLIPQKLSIEAKSGSDSDSSWCSNCDSDESDASSTRAVQNSKKKGAFQIDSNKNVSKVSNFFCITAFYCKLL